MLKKITLLFWGLFLLLILFQLWTGYAELNFSIVHLLYWFFLIGWLLVIISWKKTANFSLVFGFLVMLIGMFLFLLGIKELSEVVVRFGFAVWMVGITQALLEYRK